MAFLSEAEYPAIRASIDISLSTSNLKDAVIGLAPYKGQAEAWVLTELPEAAAYAPGTPEYLAAQRAAIYACAALLAPAVPVITGETFGNFRYTREKYDPEAVASALWGKARTAISEAAGDTPASSTTGSRFFFGTVKGRRGR